MIHTTSRREKALADKAQLALPGTKVPAVPVAPNRHAITRAFEGWVAEELGVPLPPTVSKRLPRHVGECLEKGFTEVQVKMGMVLFACALAEDPKVSPAQLDRYVYMWAFKERHRGNPLVARASNYMRPATPRDNALAAVHDWGTAAG